MLIIIRRHLIDILERERRPKTSEEIDYEHFRSSWFRDPTRESWSNRAIFWAMNYIFFSSFILSVRSGIIFSSTSGFPLLGQKWYFPRLSHSLSGQGWCFPRLWIPSALFDHWPCWWHSACSNDENPEASAEARVELLSQPFVPCLATSTCALSIRILPPEDQAWRFETDVRGLVRLLSYSDSPSCFVFRQVLVDCQWGYCHLRTHAWKFKTYIRGLVRVLSYSPQSLVLCLLTSTCALSMKILPLEDPSMKVRAFMLQHVSHSAPTFHDYLLNRWNSVWSNDETSKASSEVPCWFAQTTLCASSFDKYLCGVNENTVTWGTKYALACYP